MQGNAPCSPEPVEDLVLHALDSSGEGVGMGENKAVAGLGLPQGCKAEPDASHSGLGTSLDSQSWFTGEKNKQPHTVCKISSVTHKYILISYTCT